VGYTESEDQFLDQRSGADQLLLFAGQLLAVLLALLLELIQPTLEVLGVATLLLQRLFVLVDVAFHLLLFHGEPGVAVLRLGYLNVL